MNSIKRNLIIGYTVTLLLLIISATASFISIRGLVSSQEQVNHTNSILFKLEHVISLMKDAETGQRGFLLTNQKEFLEPYTASLKNIDRTVSELKQLTSANKVENDSVNELSGVIDKKLLLIKSVIDNKMTGKGVTIEELSEGKLYMDRARAIVGRIQDNENLLLNSRIQYVDRFTSATTLLIIIASILAIIITLLSFIKLNKDFTKNATLQQTLETNNKETKTRLEIIQNVAGKISSGDYKTRVNDAGQDILGSFSNAINQMGESLETAFNKLSEKEWLQTGLAKLNDIIIAEKGVDTLSNNIIVFLSTYVNAQAGVLYIVKDGSQLKISASSGLDLKGKNKEISFGDGLAGNCALSGTVGRLKDIDTAEMVINVSMGAFKPKDIIALPVFYNRRIKGVIELSTVHSFTPAIEEFLKAASFNIGMSINSAADHQRLKELLSETQNQAEELKSQQSELQHINSELEAQSEKLQASEEELRVQQEELQQANHELEERSTILEEKNELILKRNLEIQAKSDELELGTKYKSEFLANMSHELRTPLNSILLLSRLLSENHGSNLTEDQIEYARVINTSGNGLLTLIDEILDLSKIESGKMELENTEIELTEIKVHLNNMFAETAKQKNLEFVIDIDKNTTKRIFTDKLRLEQILRNLLSNAIKFTKKGSVKLNIYQEDSFITFKVKDTGIGIAEQKQETIFDAFQQADGSTSRQYGGTGLGLSISRELSKLLGGRIMVSSKQDEGSEFILTIPISKAVGINSPSRLKYISEPSRVVVLTVASETENTYISNKIPDGIPDDRENISNNDKIILIVEDDIPFAKSLIDYSRQKGYKAIVVVRGDEVLSIAKDVRPSAILLDIQLPVKSGWEVMEELKSAIETKDIPIHMMSSYEVKQKSISKGASGFNRKPISKEVLEEIFKKIGFSQSEFPKKVMIIEENTKHAEALAFFLESHSISARVFNKVDDGVKALNDGRANCAILDIDIAEDGSYNLLGEIKQHPDLKDIPIIVNTSKSLSINEQKEIKQYADSIVIKTAHSYQRILDEVSLFLHIVEENKKGVNQTPRYKKMGQLNEVLQGKTILIADDDVRNIFSLTKSLELYGVKVISAMDGKEAIEKLKENNIVDLILMDMMMPEMDGYESTRKIREQSVYKNLPVIAVTAKAMMGDREKCIAAGASDYITKPVDIDQLLSLLRVWLY